MSKSEDKRVTTQLNEQIKKLDSAGEISDGYHTFNELYDHRITLFVSLCNLLTRQMQGAGLPTPCWKSRKHHDDSGYDGWFIAGIGVEKGKQVSYHLPDSVWEDLLSTESDKAPEWDGHTSDDVLDRLKEYFY